MLPARTPHLPCDVPRARLQFHGVGAPGRPQVEQFVSEIYRARFGAQVRGFAPVLVSLHDAAGDIIAAAGYRPAEGSPLFLERYLDGPVDGPLACGREGIVEVGHLAASRPGAGRQLILLMGPHFAAQGYQWVVSTLTEELRHLFRRLGIVPLALGTADPARLGEEAASWGRYYDHRPLVVAGRIEAAVQALSRTVLPA